MNAQEKLEKKVRLFLMKEFRESSSKKAVSALKDTDKPYEALSLCSLEVADILFSVEERFDVSLPDYLFDDFKSMTFENIIQDITSEVMKSSSMS